MPSSLNLDETRHHFKFCPDDIWLVTPPSCHTMWMQELAGLIFNNVDGEKAKANQFFKCPFLELQALMRSGTLLEGAAKFKEQATVYPDGQPLTVNEDTVRWHMLHCVEYS